MSFSAFNRKNTVSRPVSEQCFLSEMLYFHTLARSGDGRMARRPEKGKVLKHHVNKPVLI